MAELKLCPTLLLTAVGQLFLELPMGRAEALPYIERNSLQPLAASPEPRHGRLVLTRKPIERWIGL